MAIRIACGDSRKSTAHHSTVRMQKRSIPNESICKITEPWFQPGEQGLLQSVFLRGVARWRQRRCLSSQPGTTVCWKWG